MKIVKLWLLTMAVIVIFLIVISRFGHTLDAQVQSVSATVAVKPKQYTVAVRWLAPKKTPFTGFNIYRGAQSAGPYTLIGSAKNAGYRVYADKTVALAATYWYKVRSVNNGSESVDSNLTVVKIPSN